MVVETTPRTGPHRQALALTPRCNRRNDKVADLERAMSTTTPRALGSDSDEYKQALVDAGFKKVRKPRVKKDKLKTTPPPLSEYVPPKRRPRAKRVAKEAKPKQRRTRKDTTLGLAEALSLAGSLHRTDLPIFQQLTEIISARGGPSRKRLLAAISKVF